VTILRGALAYYSQEGVLDIRSHTHYPLFHELFDKWDCLLFGIKGQIACGRIPRCQGSRWACFWTLPYLFFFFSWWDWSSPLLILAFCFGIVLKNIRLVICYNTFKEMNVIFNLLKKRRNLLPQLSFWSLTQTSLISKSRIKISLMVVWNNPSHSPSILTVNDNEIEQDAEFRWCSFISFFFSFFAVEDLPLRDLPSIFCHQNMARTT